MVKRILLTLLLLLVLVSLPLSSHAQVNPQQGHGAPSGVCLGPYVDVDAGNFYVCKVGQYALAGGSSNSSLNSITNNFINASGPLYGVTAAGLEVCDASSTNTSQTVTTPANDPPFTSAMNGWSVWGTNTCIDFSGGYTNQVPIGTLTFVSAHQITVSVAATGTNTGGLHLIFAPIEDAQLTLAENAAFNYATTNGPCYGLQLPGGIIAVKKGHFNNFTCNTQYTGGTSNGAHIQGVGRVATRLMMTPDFDFLTGAGSCKLFNSVISCFGAQTGITMMNMGIVGGHADVANPAAVTCVKTDATDDFTINFLLAAMGANRGNLHAYCTRNVGATPTMIIEDGLGGNGWDANGSNQSCTQCFFGNNSGGALSGGGFLQTFGTGWGQNQATSGQVQFAGAGAVWNSYGDVILVSPASNFVLCNTSATCIFDGLHLFGSVTGTMNAFAVSSGAGHIIVKNSAISAGNTGVVWNLATATALGDDAGGNQFTFTGAAGYGTLTAGAAIRTLSPGSTYSTAPSPGLTDCASSAGTCTQHIAGSVSIAAAATTVTVTTTAVLANSTIYITRDDTLGTKLGVTCNTATAAGDIKVSTRTPGTSFVITVQNTPAATPLCLNWEIR